MKSILSIAAMIAFTATVQAATTASKLADITSEKTDVSVVLQSAKYHTESSSYWVDRTCSRQVADGSTYVCHYVSDPQQCHDDRDCEIINNTRVCSTHTVCSGGGGHEECGYHTNYRTEYYDCSGYETHSWQVKDHDTVSNVRLVLVDAPKGLKFKESIRVTVDDDEISISSDNKTTAVIMTADVQKSGSEANGVYTQDVRIDLKAIDAAPLISPLKSEPELVSFQDGKGVVKLAGVPNPEWFKIKFRLVKPHFLASSTEIGKATFALKDMAVDASGQNVALDLSQIGVDWAKLEAGTYRLETTLTTTLSTLTAINDSALPETREITGKDKIKKK